MTANEFRDGNAMPNANGLDPRMGRQHVADIVELLNDKTLDETLEIIGRMPTQWAVEVLDEAEFHHACEVIETIAQDKATSLLQHMSPDRAADVLRWIDEPKRTELRESLSDDARSAIDKVLTYPEGTAGSLMTTEFVSVPADWTVQRTLDHVRAVERSRETIYAIYVLDPTTHRLLRYVTLRRLIMAQPDANIQTAAQAYEPIKVLPTMPSEDVARAFSKYDLLAVPVVDSTGQMLGIVTVDDVIDAMITEQTEDVQRMGGVGAIHEPYLNVPFFEMIRKRAGWLSVLFLAEMLTASAMQVFSDELDKAIVLALFIPLVMSSGGNSGSQATSLIIRALALEDVKLKDWWRVGMRELPTGLVLGGILGIIGIIRITVWQTVGVFNYGEHWKLLAITIGCALVGIVTFGSLAGSLLPFLLKRLGFDPATASAPFIATLVDVTGIVIYFSVAWLFLRGTLL